MITQKIYLYKYDWKVVVLYEVDHTDTNIVIDILRHICDDDKAYKLVYDNLNRKNLIKVLYILIIIHVKRLLVLAKHHLIKN